MPRQTLSSIPAARRQHLLVELYDPKVAPICLKAFVDDPSASLKQASPPGVYMSLSPTASNLWFGVLFVRKGTFVSTIMKVIAPANFHRSIQRRYLQVYNLLPTSLPISAADGHVPDTDMAPPRLPLLGSNVGDAIATPWLSTVVFYRKRVAGREDGSCSKYYRGAGVCQERV